jgi:hypothetical protein
VSPTAARGLAIGLAAAVVLCSRLAAADDEQPRVVLIGSLELSEETGALIRAVEGQLSDLPVEFAVEWVDQIPENLSAEVDEAREITRRTEALAVVWCDLSRADEVYLYLSDADQTRILVRRLDSGETGVRLESLAVIVRSVVDAMLRGGEIGVEVPPAEEERTPVPYQAPAPVETWADEPPAGSGPEGNERAVLFGLQVGYAASAHSSNRPVAHGVDLRLSVNARVGLEAYLGYAVRQPIAVTARDVSIDIRTHPAHIGAGWSFDLGRFGVGGGAELILDYKIQETRQVATDTAVPKGHRDLLVSVGPYLDGSLALLPDRLALRIQITVHFLINSVRYVTKESGGTRVVDDPWPIAPIGVLDLVFLI